MINMIDGELVTDFVARYKYTSKTCEIYFTCLKYLFAEKRYETLHGDQLILTVGVKIE